jgi:hypothetical protein
VRTVLLGAVGVVGAWRVAARDEAGRTAVTTAPSRTVRTAGATRWGNDGINPS